MSSRVAEPSVQLVWQCRSPWRSRCWIKSGQAAVPGPPRSRPVLAQLGRDPGQAERGIHRPASVRRRQLAGRRRTGRRASAASRAAVGQRREPGQVRARSRCATAARAPRCRASARMQAHLHRRRTDAPSLTSRSRAVTLHDAAAGVRAGRAARPSAGPDQATRSSPPTTVSHMRRAAPATSICRGRTARRSAARAGCARLPGRLQAQRADRIAQRGQLGDQVFGAPRAERLQPGDPHAPARSTSSRLVDADGRVQRLHAGWTEAARVQQRRQAGRVLVDQPLVGAHAAGRQELGDQRRQGRPDAGDLAQPTLGGELLEGSAAPPATPRAARRYARKRWPCSPATSRLWAISSKSRATTRFVSRSGHRRRI